MQRFRIYRITKRDGAADYLAFSEAFLSSPYLTGGGTFESFLPPGGYKHYQEVAADDEKEAIKAARDRPEGCWLWSIFNWGSKEEIQQSVPSLWNVIPWDALYIAQINAQLNVGFKKSLNLMMNTLKQESGFAGL
jgi:hypothetical protein